MKELTRMELLTNEFLRMFWEEARNQKRGELVKPAEVISAIIHEASGLFVVGRLMRELIGDIKISAVGCLSRSAYPMAIATAGACYEHGKRCKIFSVREKLKKDAMPWIEGNLSVGDNVVLLGGIASLVNPISNESINILASAGVKIVGAFFLIDNEDGMLKDARTIIPAVSSAATWNKLVRFTERPGL